MCVGNDISNSVWEPVGLKPWKKPDRHSTYSQREEYIKAKYDKRVFLNPPVDDENQSEEDMDRWGAALMQAVEKDDVLGALTALAHGALACFVPSEVVCHPDLKRFPLHTAARNGSFVCTVLLVMNGADIAERNEDGFNAAELASQNFHDDIELFLVRRLDLLVSRGLKNAAKHDGIASVNSTDSPASQPELHSLSHDLSDVAVALESEGGDVTRDGIDTGVRSASADDDDSFGEFEDYARSAVAVADPPLDSIPEEAPKDLEATPPSLSSKKENKQ
jgi:hypothetical protein